MVSPRKLKVRFVNAALHELEDKHNLKREGIKPNGRDIEYEPQMAALIARLIVDINTRATVDELTFAQQFILQKGLREFGEEGYQAALKEIAQLHKRMCFTPIAVQSMTDEERRKAVEALLFLTEKRDKTIKGRMVYNGKPTREWLSREESASPTVSLESIFLTSIIDAKEERDVMTTDIPNAFIHAQMPDVQDGKARVIMKITGVLVDLLVELAPEVYGPHVVYENGRKVLYVQVIRALYGMLVAALLWYQKFRADLESIGFKFNPYDPCVANRDVDGKQHTVGFHVDDLKSSHKDPQVNTDFLAWLNKMYGDHGEVKATRGKIHEYLGMKLDFTQPGKVIIDMVDYINKMVDDFDDFKPDDIVSTPAGTDLFAAGKGQLDQGRSEKFRTFVAKGLFACKRARPDTHTTIAILCTRVQKPSLTDWQKLVRLMKYLNGTRSDKLTLAADDLHVIKHYVDASFAVHPDFRSHTGKGSTMGTGCFDGMSSKQKINTRSSTESEVVGGDDASTKVLWTKLFMEAQGFEIKRNILYQDNKSAILLETNGKASSSPRTRAMNIRYFFLTDQIKQGNLEVEYVPTEDMIGDFFTKPLQGKQFAKFKKLIMGN